MRNGSIHSSKKQKYSQQSRSNTIETATELNDDLVVEIISYLPLKLAVQSKLLSKNFNTWISDPKFSQTLFLHQNASTVLIYSSSYRFYKISINPLFSTTRHEITTLPVSVSASCKGLLLLRFDGVRSFCVFNPITGAHHLVPYPEPQNICHTGLAVDYPTSDQYKLVTTGKLAGEEGYKFQVFSLERYGRTWREFQLRMPPGNTFINMAIGNKPVYVHGSMHWLRVDGRVLAFHTEREEATTIGLPDFIHNHHGPIRPGFNTWLGVAQGLLTLICLFNKSTVIAAYDYVSSNWKVTHTSANFIKCLCRYRQKFGFPIWIDSKQVLFLLDRRHVRQVQHLYEYDSEMNRYKIAAVLDKDDDFIFYDLLSFRPTLASVHKTISVTINTEHLSAITATLDEIKRFITDGTS